MADGECCVVVSFPRSGTHLTIDFLRRNFVPFAHRPWFWESGETLYHTLDMRLPSEEGMPGHSRSRFGAKQVSDDHLKPLARRNFLVKSHDLPFAPALRDKLEAAAAGRRITLLYPFRAFSRTIISNHAHRQSRDSIAEFLTGPDTRLGTDLTVEETALAHGEWALENAVPIDIERLIRDPHASVAALSARFGWEVIARQHPLPPKRIAPGRLGELFERLRGRQSSEMVARVANRPAHEGAFIDQAGRLSELHARLRRAALNAEPQPS